MIRRESVRSTFGMVYGAACYRVGRGRRTIAIQPGRRNPRLDDLLRQYGAQTWCFITAHNPGSRCMPSWRNAAAQARLARMLRSQTRTFFRGECNGAQWPTEPSFLVPGITPRAAMRLGRGMGQNAVLTGAVGGIARLLWCR